MGGGTFFPLMHLYSYTKMTINFQCTLELVVVWLWVCNLSAMLCQNQAFGLVLRPGPSQKKYCLWQHSE